MAKKKRARKGPLRREGEWVGGIGDFPVRLTDEPSTRPVVVIWLDAAVDKIVGTSVVDARDASTALVEVLAEAQVRPVWGPPRRPARLRVGSEDLARVLRAEAEAEVEVVVGEIPEFDHALEHLRTTLAAVAARRGSESYLAEGRIAAERVAELFDAAAAAFAGRPWSEFREAAPFALDAPALGLSQAVVLTAGDATEFPGVMLLDSPEAYLELTESGSDEEAGPGGGLPAVPVRTVGFHRGADVPESMRREVLAHGWKLASVDAYPVAAVHGEGGIPRDPVESDIVALTACLRALAEAATEHAQDARTGMPFSLEVSVATAEGPAAVRLLWPHPLFLDLEDDDEDPEGDDEDFGELRYDADVDPDPASWREADENERRIAVEAHHRRDRPHPRAPDAMVHSMMHAVVEDQLLADDPPAARRALGRLRDAGIRRHEAIHAIASVLSDEMHDLLHGGAPRDDARYPASLDALDGESWRRKVEAIGREEGSRRSRSRRTKRRRRT